MSPGKKVTIHRLGVKGNFRCPYCGFGHCWRHGRYWRKGFHRFGGFSDPELIGVQRYWCRNAVCERTFSLLPEGVLPYCRFFWDGLVRLAQFLVQGRTPYYLAKFEWGLPLRVVLRAVELIGKVRLWLEGLCREVAGSTVTGLGAMAEMVLRDHPWFSFTRRWFHGFYPARMRNIFNPHNLAIKRL